MTLSLIRTLFYYQLIFLILIHDACVSSLCLIYVNPTSLTVRIMQDCNLPNYFCILDVGNFCTSIFFAK